MLNDNLLMLADSYKMCHWWMYPKDTKQIYSYFESRGGIFDNVRFFGLQYILKEYMEGQVVTKDKIDEAEDYVMEHCGSFNRAGWELILNKHGGHLPLNIFAVPEGAVVPTRVPLSVVYNTCEQSAWLTNFVETILSTMWYPTTVCTQSHEIKKTITKYMMDTVGNTDGIDFMMHGFGMRSSTSMESAAIGDAAHLVSFKGTDTVNALKLCRMYYNERMAGFSVAATEHSVMTIEGKDNEAKVVERLLRAAPKDKILSMVGDSYNIFKFCSEILPSLRHLIVCRTAPLVVRPDSMEPTFIVPKVTDLLMSEFGYTVNKLGYMELPPYLRVLQGDGIDRDSVGKILEVCKSQKYAANNYVFGSGSALIQKLNRDDLKFAFKCCATKRDIWYDVYKDPYSPDGESMKKSKRGLVWTYRNKNGEYYYDNKRNFKSDDDSGMKLVFENGRVKECTLAEIRSRV